jgi:protein gp37
VSDRIGYVKKFPTKIKFLSVEPLIGSFGAVDLSGIDWVITGGESGPGARECKPEWIREVRDLCLKYRVAHFFKQWGKPENNPIFKSAVELKKRLGNLAPTPTEVVNKLDPIGKGGSLIDDRSWKEMPGEFEVADYGTDELGI